jgi:chorismate synthase
MLDTKKIPLADLLIELRRELEEARRAGEDQNLRFRVESVEVELKVTVSKGAEAGAGFKFWVINGDAKGKIAAESVQTLRLKLDPINADGSDTLVSDRDKK